MKRIDYTGQTLGLLTVLGFSPSAGGRGRIWHCQCACGNKVNVAGHGLAGGTGSCGCKTRGWSIKHAETPSGVNALFSAMRANAKRRGLAFALSRSIFQELIESRCHYCGARPQMVFKYKYVDGPILYNGIDRLDSAKPYTPENIVPCCKNCNTAKNVLSKNDFLSWVDDIHDFQHQESFAGASSGLLSLGG